MTVTAYKMNMCYNTQHLLLKTIKKKQQLHVIKGVRSMHGFLYEQRCKD